jgi:hypothetical protein
VPPEPCHQARVSEEWSDAHQWPAASEEHREHLEEEERKELLEASVRREAAEGLAE